MSFCLAGYLLGSQVSDWSHHTGFSLSTVLRMYYSADGVSYDRQFRACDRLTNFLNGDLVDQDTLKQQVSQPGHPEGADSQLEHLREQVNASVAIDASTRQPTK